MGQPLPDYTQPLQDLMHQAGLSSFKALAQRSGVSRDLLIRLRRGQIRQLRVESLLRLAQVLQVSLLDLLAIFTQQTAEQPRQAKPADQPKARDQRDDPSFTTLRLEYQRLEKQVQQQRQILWQEFQQATLEILESLLLQWPTAAQAAQNNPEAPAVRLIPLLRPLEQLLEEWQIETIGPVGLETAYDPQVHQLMQGMTQPGNPVRVRYVGYRQGEKLLYRAKVSPTSSTK